MSSKIKNNSRQENCLTGVAATHVLPKAETESTFRLGGMVGRSRAFQKVLKIVEQASRTDATVLLVGETGTGKALSAETIHQLSVRASRPLLKVNCNAFPAHLLGLKLFGDEKGACAGSIHREAGIFELAAGGTVLLNEIDVMPPAVQEKLLCLLEDGVFVRAGGRTPLEADVRVIAATRANLTSVMEKGDFLEDLCHRFTSFTINLPPLRERKEDIPALVCDFIHRYRAEGEESVTKVPQSVIQALQTYSWPGNVRELQNIVLRSLISCEEGHLELDGCFRKRQ